MVAIARRLNVFVYNFLELLLVNRLQVSYDVIGYVNIRLATQALLQWSLSSRPRWCWQ